MTAGVFGRLNSQSLVSSEGILGDGDVGEGAASERAQVEGGLSRQETDLDTFLKFHIF